jgi:hypothetical protein
MITSTGSFAILAIFWLGFGTALIFNQTLLGTTWQMFRGLPVWAHVMITFLLLPLIPRPWIWQTSRPLWIRLILVMGLGLATIYPFFPKRAFLISRQGVKKSHSHTPALVRFISRRVPGENTDCASARRFLKGFSQRSLWLCGKK